MYKPSKSHNLHLWVAGEASRVASKGILTTRQAGEAGKVDPWLPQVLQCELQGWFGFESRGGVGPSVKLEGAARHPIPETLAANGRTGCEMDEGGMAKATGLDWQFAPRLSAMARTEADVRCESLCPLHIRQWVPVLTRIPTLRTTSITRTTTNDDESLAVNIPLIPHKPCSVKTKCCAPLQDPNPIVFLLSLTPHQTPLQLSPLLPHYTQRMNIPEIRTIIAQFLSDSDLATTAQVCKSWNACFTRALYSVINTSRITKKPSKEVIVANARFIQELSLFPNVEALGMEYLYLDKQLHFPALRRLCLKVHSAFVVEHQFEIIRKCPGLRDLTWFAPKFDARQTSNVCDLFKTNCPSIECLTLHGCTIVDGDLSRILDSCHRITSFTIIPSRLGESTFRSLARHFAHVRALDLFHSGMTSKMAQQILTSCPNLTYFYGVALEACDILGVMGVSEDDRMEERTMMHWASREWVCTSLRSLRIHICGLEGKPRDWHQRVFLQLGKMEKLDTLVIAYPGFRSKKDGLDLRVEAGLDLLSSLKTLRDFQFRGLWQQMEEQDVRWMMKAWPTLRSLTGELHLEQERWDELKCILSERKDIVHIQ